MASHETLVPLGETVADCAMWLGEHAQRVMVHGEVLTALTSSLSPDERSAVVGSVGISYPGREAIRAWCRSQDILPLIGRSVRLDGRGVGSCPFKEHHHRGDLRPGFQVFVGMTHIGTVTPGGVRVISLISCACITD